MQLFWQKVDNPITHSCISWHWAIIADNPWPPMWYYSLLFNPFMSLTFTRALLEDNVWHVDAFGVGVFAILTDMKNNLHASLNPFWRVCVNSCLNGFEILLTQDISCWWNMVLTCCERRHFLHVCFGYDETNW